MQCLLQKKRNASENIGLEVEAMLLCLGPARHSELGPDLFVL
jgi:hypothetical protein